MPIDLETICLKCLQKEAGKRYASAAELADDLDRFLSGEPIRARPITAWERALKWATRRPAVAAMAALTLVVTIAGFTGVTWQWREAEKARTTAQVKADDEARARGWAEREKKRADDQRGIAEARARELAVQKKRIREELHRSNLLGGRLLLQDGNVTDAERVLWREYLTRPQVDDRRAHWALWKLYRERPRADALSLSADVIELSADGMLLVTAQGAEVSVLDVKTKSVVANFRSQHGPVASLAISPDNSLLACGHVVPTVVVWRLHGGDAPLATLEPSGTVDIPLMLEAAATAQGQNVSGVRTSMTSLLRSRPSLRFLAAETLLVLNATEMSVWDVGEESLQSHVEYSGGVPGSSSRILGVSADGSVALTLRRVRPRSLDAWDLSKMEPGRQSFAAESGKLVLAAPPSSNPFLYAIENARRRARKASGETKEGDLLRPTNAALSRDGKLLVSQSSSGRLTLWDFVERERIAEHHDPDAPVPRLDRLEISPDGGLLAGVEGTKVWLWELPSLEPRPGFSLLARSVSQVKVSGDGKTLYVAEKDSPIGLYDLKEPDAIVVMRSGGGCDGLGPQGPAVVSRGGGSQQFPLEIWDSDERQTIARGNFLTTLGRSDKRIAISPDGTLAAIGTQGFGPAAVDFYDLGMLRRTEVVRLPSKGGVGGIAFSPDGARVAVVASGRTHIIDVISKEIVGTVKTEFYFYDGEVAFSPDGRVLAVSGGPMSKTAALEPQTGALDLFDLESRERLATLVIIKGLGAMEFSPDGAHLAVASDREIILLDSGNLDVLGRLVGHTGRVLSLSYAPDGSMIASGGADETLRLWDVAQREELLSLDLGEGEVQKVVFSPDGSRLRYSSTRRVVSLDLRAFDQHIHNNLVVQLTRLIPEVVEQEGRDEALRMVERLRDIHPQAFQRGMAVLATLEAGPQ